MYGSAPYAQTPYAADSTDATDEAVALIAPPLISNAFQVFAPSVHRDGALDVPLIENAFQVFPPESIMVRGRPLAEDIRIMRVRRAE